VAATAGRSPEQFLAAPSLRLVDSLTTHTLLWPCLEPRSDLRESAHSFRYPCPDLYRAPVFARMFGAGLKAEEYAGALKPLSALGLVLKDHIAGTGPMWAFTIWIDGADGRP